MDYIASMIEKIVVERNKKVDGAILGEIQKIATENGIETRIVLDERSIVDALKRYTNPDVVEVVRCSECDHFLECGEEGYCIIMMRGMHKNGFCSSAARKEKT